MPKMNLTNAHEATAFAERLARAALELNALRALLTAHVNAPFCSPGCPSGDRTLGDAESTAFEVLDVQGDGVAGALMSIASRMHRDIGSAV
jgi:hypothetical protein